MKELSLEQIEKVEGGESTHAEVCGFAVGIVLFTGIWGVAFAIVACLSGDTEQ